MLREYHLIAGLTDWLVPVRSTVCLRARIVSLHFQFFFLFFLCKCKKRSFLVYGGELSDRNTKHTHMMAPVACSTHAQINDRERERAKKKAANEHKY